MAKPMVHLHAHSEYSILDGQSRTKDMAKRAVELGHPAIAITDHGTMGGCLEFYMNCKKQGIKPIIGMEAYIAPFGTSRKERVAYQKRELEGKPGFVRNNYHLILLAKNKVGYENLCALSTESYATGYYYKPRIDYELLREHHEGIICQSACVLGEVQNHLWCGDWEKAKEVALFLRETFGDDFYLEGMNHHLDMEVIALRRLRELSKEIDIPIVATNDSHYIKREDSFTYNFMGQERTVRFDDHKLQRTLMLLGMHKTWEDRDVTGSFWDLGEDNSQRMVEDKDAGDSDPIFMTPPDLYIKDYDEMMEVLCLDPGDREEAERELDITLEIAEKCNCSLDLATPGDLSSYHIPQFDFKNDVHYDEFMESGFQTPQHTKDAIVAKGHEIGKEGNSVEEMFTPHEVESLRFISWLCDRGMRRLIEPKIQHLGEPLPDDTWIQNPPDGFAVEHRHNSPDETWIKGQLAEGKTADDLMQIYWDRLDEELSIVLPKGFIDYFAIVQDYCNYTRFRKAQIGPARGSGAGSLLNYLIGITSVDPIPNKLLFSRFISIDRIDYPDIDLDWSKTFRDNDLWPHLREEYGMNSSSAVATYTFFWGKAAVKAAGRVLFSNGYDAIQRAIDLTDLLDNTPKLDLRNELDGSNEAFCKLVASDVKYRQIVEMAMLLQGRVASTSQHASAFILSPFPITNKLPLMVSKEERELSQKTGSPVTNYLIQYDGYSVGDLGFIKLDLLCVKDLEVIQKSIETIERVYGTKIDIEAIPLDMGGPLDMIKAGNVAGIFQFDSSPVARRLLMDSRADCITDWSNVNACNRPGPLQMGYDQDLIRGKLHPETISYFTPAAEQYLKDSYGVALTQESLMLMVQDPRICGVDAAEADHMRKILAKKKKDKLEGLMRDLHAKAAENGVPKKIIDDFCDIATAAGSYSFNASHSFAYALIAYRGATIKYYFPDAFFAALAQIKPMQKGKDRIADFMMEAKQMGVTVKPPHVNYSEVEFDVPERGVIAYGLNRIKGVGKAAEPIVEERHRNGPFKDFSDFMTRVPREVGKSALLPLIHYGALDGLGWSRRAMEESIDQVIEFRKRYFASKEQRANLATDLFSIGVPEEQRRDDNIVLTPPFDTEYNERQMMELEKKFLGMYMSRTPEDYHKLTRFMVERQAQATWAAAARAQRDIPAEVRKDMPPRPVNVGDVASLADKTLVEFVCVVSDGAKNRPNPRIFQSGKGCSIQVQDWGKREESREGFSPVLYTTRLTMFSRLMNSTPLPQPGDLIHVVGRVSLDPEGKWPPAVLLDSVEVLGADSALIGKMSREELLQLKRDYERHIGDVADPTSDAYLVPIMTFPDRTAMNNFVEAKTTQRYFGDGHAVLTFPHDTSGGLVLSLKQTVGMVRHAQTFGAQVQKMRLPAAKAAEMRGRLMGRIQ